MHIPIESLNMKMLNVGQAFHNGDWNWADVCSPFARIFLVSEGTARLILPSETVTLTPGHLYVIPPHTTHSYECHGLLHLYYLHVCEGFKTGTDVFETYSFPTEVRAGACDKLLFEQMCAAHPEARLPQSDPRSYDNAAMFNSYLHRYNDQPLYEKMRLRGSILILLSRFMQEATALLWTRDERLMKVLAHIHSHSDESVSLTDLANLACVTQPHLTRLFRQNFGMAPRQYINKRKVERAQLVLLTEQSPVKEVAYRLGFNDHSYFIRLFHKMTGLTPQEYRNVHCR